jgi:hypothetical protein
VRKATKTSRLELLAWFALVINQPRQAIDSAQQGLTLAPTPPLVCNAPYSRPPYGRGRRQRQ